MDHSRIRKCFSCESLRMDLVFSLGAMPQVNAFLAPNELVTERKFPLDLYFCHNCSLVQLGETVPPEQLFSRYLHMSSASEANRRHLEAVAAQLFPRLGLDSNSQILEIGSNDGSLLKSLAGRAERVLGVDPAENLADIACAAGVETLVTFFNEETARAIEHDYGRFDAIVALNVVAHTPHFMSLLKGVRSLLKPGGKFFMENAYVVDTILQGQFDTIYHEHVHNFSLHALCSAYERAGLVALDAEIIPTQGTSIRVVVGRSDDSHRTRESVREILEHEEALGLTRPELFQSAATKVIEFRTQLKSWLTANRGKRIVGLGAPARGVVILNYCGITPDDVSYIVDDTPLKQGLLTPGTHIEVSAWDRLSREPGETFLMLSWNYRDDLLRRLRPLAPLAKVLIPFPNMEEITL
jgi:SAM-dependent methyltransferase